MEAVQRIHKRMMLDELEHAQLVDEWDATTVCEGEDVMDLAADLERMMVDSCQNGGEEAADDDSEATLSFPPHPAWQPTTVEPAAVEAPEPDAAAGPAHPTGGLVVWLIIRRRVELSSSQGGFPFANSLAV